jgi:hypothetical protein
MTQRTTGLQMAIDRAGGLAHLAKLLRTKPHIVQSWRDLDDAPRTVEVPQSPVLDAVDAAGGRSALAEAMGVTRQAVEEWRRQGWVPLARAKQIEDLYGIPRAGLLSPKVRSDLGLDGGAL